MAFVSAVRESARVKWIFYDCCAVKWWFSKLKSCFSLSLLILIAFCRLIFTFLSRSFECFSAEWRWVSTSSSNITVGLRTTTELAVFRVSAAFIKWTGRSTMWEKRDKKTYLTDGTYETFHLQPVRRVIFCKILSCRRFVRVALWHYQPCKRLPSESFFEIGTRLISRSSQQRDVNELCLGGIVCSFIFRSTCVCCVLTHQHEI